VLVPFASADRGEAGLVRLSSEETAQLKERNEARLALLLRRFRGDGFDPIVLSSSSVTNVDTAFQRWAERRRLRRRRR
jgi:hypothetical protein